MDSFRDVFNNARKKKRRNLNPCGESSTCQCSQGSHETITVKSCRALSKGNYLLSNIVASRISIKEMFDLHSQENQRKNLGVVGLIISNTTVEEIVDLNETALTNHWIPLLIFENNPELVIGLQALDRLNIKSLEFHKYGARQFFGYMFNAMNVTFSDFSTSLSGIYDKDRSKKSPWYWFDIEHLVFEGQFTDFPDLTNSTVIEVTIRNVISSKKNELLPKNFLTNIDYVTSITIQNSEYVTIPKFYLDEIYKPRADDINLSLSLEISNVQQHSLVGKYVSRLIKLNHVMVNESLRKILSSEENKKFCESFCVSINGSEKQCNQLNEYEKIACGICVKNIVGSSNLERLLAEVCAIMPSTTVVSTSKRIERSSDTTASKIDGG